MKKTPLQRYLHLAIAGEVFSQSDIIGARRLLNGDALERACYFRLDANRIREGQAEQLVDLLYTLSEQPRDILPSHTEQGKGWFADMHRLPGTWRNTALTRQIPEYARQIVDGFAKFQFVGFFEDSNGYRSFYTPAFRVIDTQGRSFDYAYGAWQSGGRFIIL